MRCCHSLKFQFDFFFFWKWLSIWFLFLLLLASRTTDGVAAATNDVDDGRTTKYHHHHHGSDDGNDATLSSSISSGEGMMPNIVILFADNLGYEDVGWFQQRHRPQRHSSSFSSKSSSLTPNIDRIAKEGMTFYNWNSAAHLCSASRAALLTGKYPVRTGVYPRVFRNDAMYGLLPTELTLPELLKQQKSKQRHSTGPSIGDNAEEEGTTTSTYATSIVGKWHLGHRPEYLPTNQGFDEWIGIPYHMSGGSIDNHTCNNEKDHHVNFTAWLPLYNNTEIIQQPVDINQLAQIYASSAVNFIHRHATSSSFSSNKQTRKSTISESSTTETISEQSKPFFLYMAFSHVHQLCAPRDYPEQMTCQWSSSSTPASSYASSSSSQFLSPFDSAVHEMDWIAGEILKALDDTNTTNNTIVLFTSDNGPWVAEQSCSGSKGPFEGKWLQDNVDQSCTACPHDYVPQPTEDRPRRCVLPNNPSLELDGVHCGDDTGLGSVWEANLRMPAMVRFPPHIPSNSSTNAMVSTLDVVPTILSMIADNSATYTAEQKDIIDGNGQETTTTGRSRAGRSRNMSPELLEDLDGRDASRIWYGEIDDWDEKDENGTFDRVLYFWRDGFTASGGPLPPPYGRMDVAAVKVGKIKLWFWTKSAHYNDDVEAYHDPPLLFDVLEDPAESKPLDPTEYEELIKRVKHLVEHHKTSIDWGLPLALASDSRYLPCVNQSNDCRTNPVGMAEKESAMGGTDTKPLIS